MTWGPSRPKSGTVCWRSRPAPPRSCACPLWLKTHSRGEYVFDWAWAEAYERHGLPYYPKAIVASPFTPVPGTRLLARSAADRMALLQALTDWCGAEHPLAAHPVWR